MLPLLALAPWAYGALAAGSAAIAGFMLGQTHESRKVAKELDKVLGNKKEKKIWLRKENPKEYIFRG